MRVPLEFENGPPQLPGPACRSIQAKPPTDHTTHARAQLAWLGRRQPLRLSVEPAAGRFSPNGRRRHIAAKFFGLLSFLAFC